MIPDMTMSAYSQSACKHGFVSPHVMGPRGDKMTLPADFASKGMWYQLQLVTDA